MWGCGIVCRGHGGEGKLEVRTVVHGSRGPVPTERNSGGVTAVQVDRPDHGYGVGGYTRDGKNGF
jgi:hypothetical protein